MTYEYNEITNEINPVYLDLSKMTNREIYISFGDGLTNENLVKKLTDRYGKNEYYMNMNLLHLYFKKVEFPSFIIVLIIGAFECYLKEVWTDLVNRTTINKNDPLKSAVYDIREELIEKFGKDKKIQKICFPVSRIYRPSERDGGIFQKILR